jgi:hypothetical protein
MDDASPIQNSPGLLCLLSFHANDDSVRDCHLLLPYDADVPSVSVSSVHCATPTQDWLSDDHVTKYSP